MLIELNEHQYAQVLGGLLFAEEKALVPAVRKDFTEALEALKKSYEEAVIRRRHDTLNLLKAYAAGRDGASFLGQDRPETVSKILNIVDEVYKQTLVKTP